MIENKNNNEYMMFCGELANLFNQDWEKIKDRIVSGWQYLNHVPDAGWKPMTRLAVDTWEYWPRNWVKSVKDIYALWKTEDRVERSVTNCEYCNGNGYFSGIRIAEVKPGIWVSYRYTWRCGGCRNWFGKMGEKIPAAYPLEVKTNGFDLDIYSKPMSVSERQESLTEILEGIGNRTNPKRTRPDIMSVRESFTDEQIPF